MMAQQHGAFISPHARTLLALVLALLATSVLSGCDRADDEYGDYARPDEVERPDDGLPPPGTPANPGGSTP